MSVRPVLTEEHACAREPASTQPQPVPKLSVYKPSAAVHIFHIAGNVHTVATAMMSCQVMPRPAGIACGHDICCTVASRSQETQATIPTAEKGAQCTDPEGAQEEAKCNTASFSTAGTQTEATSAETRDNLLECGVCCKKGRKFFVSQDIAHTHWQSTHAKPPGKCFTVMCPHSSNTRELAEEHEGNHTEEKSYACRFCPKQYCSRSNVVAHERVHTGKKLHACSLCHRTFSRRTHLTDHEKTHTGERPYACSVCQKSFSRQAHLLNHKRVHTGEKPYTCGVCGKCFSYKRNLATHERMHAGKKPFVCSTCQKSFTRKATLVNHERVHTGERPFICSICQKSFTRPHLAKKHTKVVHGLS